MAHQIKRSVHPAVVELREMLQRELGDKFVRLYHFGSRVEGGDSQRRWTLDGVIGESPKNLDASMLRGGKVMPFNVGEDNVKQGACVGSLLSKGLKGLAILACQRGSRRFAEHACLRLRPTVYPTSPVYACAEH